MAHLLFSHGYAGTIPIPLLDRNFLVFVKPAGTQGRPEIDLVLGQSLDDNRRNRFLVAQFCVRVFQVCVGKGRHGLCGLFDLEVTFLGCQAIALQTKRL